MINAPGSAFNAIKAASCHRAMQLRSNISPIFLLSDGLNIPGSRWRDAPPGA
jgi:hypothetical protein